MRKGGKGGERGGKGGEMERERDGEEDWVVMDVGGI